MPNGQSGPASDVRRTSTNSGYSRSAFANHVFSFCLIYSAWQERHYARTDGRREESAVMQLRHNALGRVRTPGQGKSNVSRYAANRQWARQRVRSRRARQLAHYKLESWLAQATHREFTEDITIAVVGD